MSLESGPSFTSPDDFLAYLQRALAEPYLRGVPDPKFHSQTQKQLGEVGIDPAEFASPNHGLNKTLKQLVDEILSGVDATMRQQITSSIAFGVLTAGTINARILKSPDRNYAVVIHSGLMLLLNKFFKHVHGWANPNHVIYCNRKNAQELTADDLRDYLFELAENCNRLGAPYGPMLRLDTSGQLACSGFLHFSEMFIVCHEIGHFLNGDLDDSSAFSAFDGHQWVQEFVENVDHAKEYAADATGFRLMQAVLGYDPASPAFDVMPSIVLLFNLLYLLGGRDSATHPHPLNRSLKLIEHFYGPERATVFKESYDEPTKLFSLFRDV